ncbi:Indole-3-glycerol phosphate synthase [bioreactor metagenome]|uniref:indole-3-glycerol-phosphate synthase n=1 Tax=bioreactor metagenome TaxID=1076179 RepID=A0A644XFZ4_9ZZZZ
MTGFRESLQRKKASGFIPVIPDIKLISPKEGHLFRDRGPVSTAVRMEELGAPAISVVTEPKEFGGSMKLLLDIVSAVSVPVLRKDFITDEDDLKRTKDCGASAVLLICACLTKEKLRELYEASLLLSLEPLVEAHTKEALLLADSLGAKLVGINNRDILSLERDGGGVSLTRELASFVPEGALLVSESGIETPGQAKAAILAGAGAVLVGTALWKSENFDEFYEELCRGESKQSDTT